MSSRRYKKTYVNPSYACPICGASLLGDTAKKLEGKKGHECAPRVLRAIDAAHEKDSDECNTRLPSLYERLRAGFELLDSNERD
jgi:hypothetical protein